MKNQSALILLGISMFLFSCKKSETPYDPTSSLPASTTLNVSYGADAAQKMDVYLPAGRTVASTKLMIVIHGGGWSSGDKSDMNAVIDTMKKRMPTWAVINLNYRLASGNTNLFPIQENDVKLAIDFIFSKRAEYAISDKWVLLGASAGGHLSLLQGYKYNTPIKPKAIVNYFGPSDMADLYNNPASPLALPTAVSWLLGGIPAQNPTLYSQSSPINFINAQSPPTITLQGGLDPLVSPSQQIALHQKLSLNNVVNQLKIYPTQSHGWTGADLINSFDLVQVFLQQNVP